MQPETTVPGDDSASELPWPFTERRKRADRRVGDRREGERRKGDRRMASASASAANSTPSFTRREREIVEQLMQGMTNRQIAQALGMAETTVKKHLQHVYRKFGVRSRALLIIEQSARRR